MFNGTQAVNLDTHDITGLEKPHGIHPHPHARWRAGGDDVAGLKWENLRCVGHKFGNREDHIGGVGVLAQFVIHPCADAQRLRVARLVG